MAPWFPAFGAAAALSLISVPVLRRVALSSQFVDMPDRRKVHRQPIPYLGGVALILAVLVGILFEGRLTAPAAMLVLAAALLGTMGLIDDDHHLEPAIRLGAEVAAATVAVVVGLRAHVTGVVVLDMLLTVVWIVGVTNAFNLLDNMDGLAAGVAAVAATAVFLLAVLGGQPVVATLAAATMGACCGFIVYNRPPATIFMGDAGSLFLGFVLAILTIDLNLNPLGPPFSFAVPLMLLALPVLDTTTVTLARMRRGRAVSEGGKDHLSHRLVQRGFSAKAAVGFLVSAEAVVGLLGVLAGRRVIPLWASVVAAAAVVAVVAAVTLPMKVYTEPVVGLSRRLKLVVALGAVAVPCLALPAVMGIVRAGEPARDAADSADRALAALSRGEPGAARHFEAARQSYAEARRHIRGFLPSIALAIPGLSSNLSAARTVTDIGYELSSMGARFAALEDSQRLPVTQGQVALREVERLAPLVREVADALVRANREVSSVERGFLAAPLDDAVLDLRERIQSVVGGATRAATSLERLPTLLGSEGPRRYFLAFQNNTELRGAGGLIGNWGELVAADGRLQLTRFGRLDELNAAYDPSAGSVLPADFTRRWSDFVNVEGRWDYVNVSPDFPTTADMIARLYERSGGSPVDGVIALDAEGLASILELTGPVVVPGWAEPITSTNVVDVTLRDAATQFPDEAQRLQFAGDVARTVTLAFTSVNLGSPATLGSALGQAVTGRHLMVSLRQPEGQRLMETLGASGAVPPLSGDSLAVVTQNLAANDIDYYLQRTVRYAITLDPSDRPAGVKGTVEVELQNGAGGQSPPATASGPRENRSYVSVYGPLVQSGGTLDGTPLTARSQQDLGRPVQSTTISVPALQTRTLSLPVSGELRLSPDGWYRLDLGHQPTIRADRVEVSIRLPGGWKAAEVRGARLEDDRLVTADFQQASDHTVWVRVERTGWGRLADRFLGDT